MDTLNTGICTYNLYQCVSMSIYSVQNTSMRGYPGSPLERVFGKTWYLTQSLYARARIGIVSNTPKMDPKWTPTDTPGPWIRRAICRTQNVPFWVSKQLLRAVRYRYVGRCNTYLTHVIHTTTYAWHMYVRMLCSVYHPTCHPIVILVITCTHYISPPDPGFLDPCNPLP